MLCVLEAVFPGRSKTSSFFQGGEKLRCNAASVAVVRAGGWNEIQYSTKEKTVKDKIGNQSKKWVIHMFDTTLVSFRTLVHLL